MAAATTATTAPTEAMNMAALEVEITASLQAAQARIAELEAALVAAQAAATPAPAPTPAPVTGTVTVTNASLYNLAMPVSGYPDTVLARGRNVGVSKARWQAWLASQGETTSAIGGAVTAQ